MPIEVSQVKDAIRPNDSELMKRLKTARDGMCSIYQNAPGWYTNNPRFTSNTLNRVASSIMDNVCSDKPLPPPQKAPVPGGQCRCDTYDVLTRTDVLNPTTGAIVSTSQGTRRLPGAIGGLGIQAVGTSSQPKRVRTYLVYNVGCQDSPGMEIDFTVGDSDASKSEILSITKVSGADTCGNAPASDPPSVLAPSVKFDINLPDLRVNIPVVVPIVIFKPTLNLSPNLSVNFNLSMDLGGMRVNFDGDKFYSESEITNTDITNVNTNISNTQTNLNTSISNSQSNVNTNTNNRITTLQTNVNTNTNTSIANSQTAITNSTNTAIANSQTAIANSTSTSISNSQTAINNNTNTSITNLKGDINASINALNIDLTAKLNLLAQLVGIINANVNISLELLNRINAKPDCPELPPPPDQVPAPPDQKPPDDGGDSPSKKKLAYVEVILTKLPDKSQFGNAGAQNVYFAGWFAFRSNTGGFHPREQINFQRSLFVAPAGCDGYTHTFTHGARGRILEYYV